jgi:methylthioribose-1-phosphate isomerase
LARHHGVPFYCAAPSSTIDAQLADGDAIPIEERDAAELRWWHGRAVIPPGAGVMNPAFDVTPARYVNAYILDRGVVQPPFDA